MTIPQAFQSALQYHQAGQLTAAETIYRQILAVEPRNPDALNLLGVIAHQAGHHELAAEHIRQSLAIYPGNPYAHSNLGAVCRALGQREKATACFQRALRLKPDYPEACNNLGDMLRDDGAHDEAIALYRRAIQLNPQYAKAHVNLGNALADRGHHDEALAACRMAMQFQPDSGDAKRITSFLLLMRGDFEHGWPLFEARWSDIHLVPFKQNFQQPMWQGEALHGQRVLLHAEQGLGDTLQFVRYAPLIAQRGGQVIVECQSKLETLLRGLQGATQVIARGAPLPDFDLHCPLMSLPLAFGTRVETIPADIPYLHADTQKVARWQERLQQAVTGAAEREPLRPLKVGLVWAGGDRPNQPMLRPVNQRRSMHLSQFASLATIPGVVFISLQKGDPAAEAKNPPSGMRLLDWTNELEDFADTAALVECLDLVISVDTAVAHLAGAMGKPVWLLNRFDTCWRWLTEREDSPWYPTMRLFRQPRYGDWEPVMNSVREQLTLLASPSAPKV